MSYEGYEQYLCTEGHLTEYDTYDTWNLPPFEFECPTCSSGKAFVWGVNCTNGEVEGDDNTKLYTFEVLERKESVCDMGHRHLLEPIRYVIPN